MLSTNLFKFDQRSALLCGQIKELGGGNDQQGLQRIIQQLHLIGWKTDKHLQKTIKLAFKFYKMYNGEKALPYIKICEYKDYYKVKFLTLCSISSQFTSSFFPLPFCQYNTNTVCKIWHLNTKPLGMKTSNVTSSCKTHKKMK